MAHGASAANNSDGTTIDDIVLTAAAAATACPRASESSFLQVKPLNKTRVYVTYDTSTQDSKHEVSELNGVWPANQASGALKGGNVEHHLYVSFFVDTFED